MTFRGLIKKNIFYFAKYYRLIAIASTIMVAIILGSLIIGDSVRNTLINRVSERIGDAETVIFSGNSYMSDDIMQSDLLNKNAKAYLITNGFIPHEGKQIPVSVWGVSKEDVSKGNAKINMALANELGKLDNIKSIALRLPQKGVVPPGSLFVSDNYTTGIRLSIEGILSKADGGNINLENEQIIPLNIFVNRDELADLLDVEGKINLILSDNYINNNDFENIWNFEKSGLSTNILDTITEIKSDRIFLQNEITNTICESNKNCNRLFSYLANSIEHNQSKIPYSFITALDSYNNETLQKNDIILSDYTATKLNANIGDTIIIRYYKSQNLKTLVEKSTSVVVKKIVPISDLVNDKTLSANFPGLSNVDRCTDWDSDLPIDMNLITDEDEKYWELYKNTPKAIIAYDAVAPYWSNAYGNATAIRVEGKNPDLSLLNFEMFGLQLLHLRESSLYAAKSGVDFSGLFLSLGFFIIISSILLMIIPVSEMIFKRKNEIELLSSLGYSKKRISRILWQETAPIVILSNFVGVFVGILYTSIIMWLLGSLWQGATHTSGFEVYIGIQPIIIGVGVGILLSLWILFLVIRNNLGNKKNNAIQNVININRKKIILIAAALLSVFTIILNATIINSVVFFVIAGVLIIGTATFLMDYLISINTSSFSRHINIYKIIWNTIFINKKQALLSFIALTIGVFIVFSVGLNRKGFADSSQIITGTGGYTLWGESSVPIYHNMETPEGREKLYLSNLPSNTHIMQCYRYIADEASCLNLNKVVNPTVLGVDIDALENSQFKIQQGINLEEATVILKKMKEANPKVYPALVDATVLTWSLYKNIGDTIFYKSHYGEDVAVQIIGTLSNSIFQGQILMNKDHFSQIWNDITGSNIFLLKTDDAETLKTKTLLSQALNEYGVRMWTTNERLKQFNSVTDTYLTIFLTLGSLGLLLGFVSFSIVIRKNLAIRKKEIDLYRTIGFPDLNIKNLLFKENMIVPIASIITGVVSSIISLGPSITNVGVWIWLLSVFFILVIGSFVIFFLKININKLLKKNRH